MNQIINQTTKINIELDEGELITIVRELGKGLKKYKEMDYVYEIEYIRNLLQNKLEPLMANTEMGQTMGKYIGVNFADREELLK